MSVKIDLGQCISCNLCVPVCPNRAIADLQAPDGSSMFVVKDSLCSECKDDPDDFYSDHQCISACPVDDCITIDVSHGDTTEILKARGAELGDFRVNLGLPRNYSYTENADLEPKPGEFGPEPSHPEGSKSI